jgi:hypothetical protein
MAKRSWIPGIALALIGCMLLPNVWDVKVLRYVIAGFVVVGLGAALVAVIRSRRAHDPYDLGELKSVHEKEELMRLWADELQSDDRMVLCRCCNTVYEARLGVCPECGSFSGS